jgi:hypothetical protein
MQDDVVFCQAPNLLLKDLRSVHTDVSVIISFRIILTSILFFYFMHGTTWVFNNHSHNNIGSVNLRMLDFNLYLFSCSSLMKSFDIIKNLKIFTILNSLKLRRFNMFHINALKEYINLATMMIIAKTIETFW